MKTEWDYSELATAYVSRPQYSQEAVDAIFSIAGVQEFDTTCDVGAGVGHLTKHHLRANFVVTAIEPNDEMRRIGINETMGKCNWVEGTGENTGQKTSSYKLVTFGSSFNVCDREKALAETRRILVPGGWFACLWNHRDLTDETQKSIESIIKSFIPNYGYGTRRDDQTKVIESSKLFKNAIQIQSSVKHSQTIDECIKAWKSHATLERQAGNNFNNVIDEIQNFLRKNFSTGEDISIPYQTTCWVAQSLL
jgi:ubiquinone/menaquinone biosynthesis C-methylase UbiE